MKKIIGSMFLAASLIGGTPSTSVWQVTTQKSEEIQENFDLKALVKELRGNGDNFELASENLITLILTELQQIKKTKKVKNNYNNINESLDKYNESLNNLELIISELITKEPRVVNEVNEVIAIMNSRTKQVKEVMTSFKEMVE